MPATRPCAPRRGAGARAWCAHALPDLVLLDWMLPGMGGIELRAPAARRASARRTVPIIMLTARAEEHDKRRRARKRRRRLRDQAVQPARAARARQGRAAPARAAARPTTGGDRGGLRLDPATHRVGGAQQNLDARPDRVSPAAFPHDPSRARVLRAPSCSTTCGATTCSSRSAPSTCTSAGCARRSSRPATTG